MNEADNQWPAEMHILRREWQVDALLGASVALLGWRFLLSAQPFRVLDSGAPQSQCDLCVPDAALVSFDAGWGVALQLTAARMR